MWVCPCRNYDVSQCFVGMHRRLHSFCLEKKLPRFKYVNKLLVIKREADPLELNIAYGTG